MEHGQKVKVIVTDLAVRNEFGFQRGVAYEGTVEVSGNYTRVSVKTKKGYDYLLRSHEYVIADNDNN